ncbi:TetR/AcrR family transcriptional regulator [Mycobacterium paraense]|uniref:TetR/AcrR family transcriptional regulator n=1 Tax=Mycobacterium paraense TaxID=767916 RepID=UPI000A15FDCF|nr:TetR/AcrR family transcriptional regulator [Mycobacterium paraense]
MVRGESRTDAILDAVLELMAATGYERLTIDAVAARAGASKATIYRRWPGKPELVMAALSRQGTAAAADVDTGDLRGDLVQAIKQMRDSLASQDGALILGLLNAMRENGELAEHVRGQVLRAKRSVIGELVARAIERGELPARADHELASEIAAALVFTRILVTGQPLDDVEVARIVDAVLMPVLTRGSGKGEP